MAERGSRDYFQWTAALFDRARIFQGFPHTLLTTKGSYSFVAGFSDINVQALDVAGVI